MVPVGAVEPLLLPAAWVCDAWGPRPRRTDLLHVHLTEVGRAGAPPALAESGSKPLAQGTWGRPGLGCLLAGCAHLPALCSGRSLQGARDAEIQEPWRPRGGQAGLSSMGSEARWPAAAVSGPGWAFQGGQDLSARRCLCQTPVRSKQPHMPWQEGAGADPNRVSEGPASPLSRGGDSI